MSTMFAFRLIVVCMRSQISRAIMGSGIAFSLTACDTPLLPPNPAVHPANAYVIGLGELPTPTTPPAPQQPAPFRLADGNLPRNCSIPVNQRSNNDLTDVLPLNPNSGILYPGGLITAASLNASSLTQVSLPHASLAHTVLTLNDVTASPGSPVITSIDIPHPSNATINAAQTKLLSQTGLNFPNQSVFSTATSSSAEDELLQIGVSANWMGASLTASFDHQQQTYTSSMVVKFYQAFYTLSVDYPDGVFESNVDQSDLQPLIASDPPIIAPGEPPVFIQSVTYGRILVMLVSSSESSDKLRSAVTAAFNGVGGSGSGSLTSEQTSTLQQASYQVYALGGDSKIASAVNTAPTYAGVQQYLTTGASYSPTNPGAPISFRAQYFDNQPAAVGFTTDYNGAQQCTPIAFRSPLHVWFHQGTDTQGHSDDKDSGAHAFIKLFAHNQLLGSYRQQDGNNWSDGSTVGPVDLPFQSSFSMADCPSATLVLGEDSSSDGWKVDILVTGDLVDGSQSGVVIHRGPVADVYKIGHVDRHDGPTSVSIQPTCSVN